MRHRHTPAATDHRPWALPEKPWVMAMTWQELLWKNKAFSLAKLAR